MAIDFRSVMAVFVLRVRCDEDVRIVTEIHFSSEGKLTRHFITSLQRQTRLGRLVILPGSEVFNMVGRYVVSRSYHESVIQLGRRRKG